MSQKSSIGMCVCVCDIVRLLGFDVFILLSSAFTLMLYVFEKEKSTISKFIIKDFHLKLKKVFSIWHDCYYTDMQDSLQHSRCDL